MHIRKFEGEDHLKINILVDDIYISYSVMWFETLRKLCDTYEFFSRLKHFITLITIRSTHKGLFKGEKCYNRLSNSLSLF